MLKKIKFSNENKQVLILEFIHNKIVDSNNLIAIRAREQAASAPITDIEMSTTSVSSASETDTSASTTSNQQRKTPHTSAMDTIPQNQTENSSLSNPCALCLTEEKRLACLPCGHLATCVPCGHSLRSCPICRREINAFIRIYI